MNGILIKYLLFHFLGSLRIRHDLVPPMDGHVIRDTKCLILLVCRALIIYNIALVFDHTIKQFLFNQFPVLVH